VFIVILDSQALSEMRSKTVIKANDLIQKSRFNLSLQQQKIVLYLISQITPYDEEFKLYEFDIGDFCRVCGINETSGKNYSTLKAAVKEIADKSLWISIAEDEETLLRWIEKPYINKKSGVIKIRLDEDMKPFLLQLKKNFTTYEIFWTLSFKSKYSIRLYELVKSIHYHELETYERVFNLEELKRMLGAETYKTYQSFKERAFLPAVKEVNMYSDKTIKFEAIKRGRSVEYIKIIADTKSIIERTNLQIDIEKNFGLNQLTLWDFTK
jgi:plasmid replication initiation protein